MKILRLVSGVLSMVLFLIITVQSCAVSLGNALEENYNDTSDAGGIFVAFGLLASGIVATALWKNTSKGGDIALIILYGLTAFVGFANQGTFVDLYYWSYWSLICAIIAVIALFCHYREEADDE